MVGVTLQPIDSYNKMTPMTPMTPFLYGESKYKKGKNAHTRKTPAYMEIAVTGVTRRHISKVKAIQFNNLRE